MRYGIFSDVHSNLEAFEVVLDYYRKQNLDKFIFLGDIVGYGADPNRCIGLLKALDPVCIAGNHDWAAINKFSTEYFNQYAKEAIFWTRKNLEPKAIGYLQTFELTYQEDDFFCVHGAISEPQNFDYVLEIGDAVKNFSYLDKKLCFIGHSHCTEIYFLENNEVFYSRKLEIKLKKGTKYIINVGSVGQPRDRNPRASLCIYDGEQEIVKFVRLEYNVEKAAEKILNNGLPAMLASRLFVGR